MKTTSKWIVYIATGSVLAMLLAACGPRHHSPEARADWVVEKITRKLDLDQGQTAKLNAVKEQVLVAREEMRQHREENRDTVTDLLNQPTLDRDKAMNLVTERTKAINEQAPQVIAALGEFYDSLTTEQQTRLREEIQERMEHRRHHWGPGPH